MRHQHTGAGICAAFLALLLLVAHPTPTNAAMHTSFTATVTHAVGCFFSSIFGDGCTDTEVAIVQEPPPVTKQQVPKEPETRIIEKPIYPDIKDLESKYDALTKQIERLTLQETVATKNMLIVERVPAPPSTINTQIQELIATLGTTIESLSNSTLGAHTLKSITLDEVNAQINKATDRVYDTRHDAIDAAIEDIASLEDVTLTNPTITNASFAGSLSSDLFTFTGTSTFDGDTTFDVDTLYVDALNNRVAVGTTTTSAALTVAGDISAGTTTAKMYDTGGAVCNVKAYGAVGDNSTNDYTAIMAAINDCPEGAVVLFPMGQYRINQPIVLDKPITLRGTYSPRWSYSSAPRSTIRANFGSFVGDAIIHVRDRTISGETDHNNGGRLENISIDGGSWGTDITGIYFEGLVRDWKLTDVDISQTTGNGFEAAVGTGEGNPRGFTIRGLSIYSADGHGFRATALNDSYLEDVLAVGNALRGFYISSMGETKINNSRSAFNALEGLYIDGSSNNGGLMFTDFSTDRNDRHGVRISSTGTTTVTFNGLLTRRDGANVGGGAETPYAGVAVIGTTTESVAPVFINGLSQIVGKDDSNNPPVAPLVGVRVTNAQYVKVDGQLWGVDDAYVDGGGNDHFIIAEDSIVKTGTDGWSTIAPELYTNKWVASSTQGLIYDGKINIGSSTDSRLLNIVAESEAGARFRDTTNDVIFDMRAEDYQGFFGTFSNHQLRFQTNNTSRLTIDTNGYIGIATTSPNYQFDVEHVGTGIVAAFANNDGVCVADPTAGSFSCTSDLRLKKNIETIPDALPRLLELRGVNYHWKTQLDDDDKYGFIAQELEDVFPDLVTKDARGYKLVNTLGLTSVIVEAIKELHDAFAALGASIQNGILTIQSLIATDTLCIDDTCIDEEQLRELLDSIDAEPTTGPTPSQPTIPDPIASSTEPIPDPIASSTSDTPDITPPTDTAPEDVADESAIPSEASDGTDTPADEEAEESDTPLVEEDSEPDPQEETSPLPTENGTNT
ncbi:MAG: tail fiber domain-containing protein [Candidatus Pacebacteria bacterium]|nr:tail fiber domain-containing protein [Candidatus Paceibacterota bacterium]